MRRTERKQRGHLCQLCFFYGLHRASAHNRGIFNAKVVHGLQVRDVREGGVSLQPKYSKSAEVVHGLQVRHVREGGSIFIWSRGFFHEMHRASAHNRGIFNAKVVHGLQVRDVREGGVSLQPKCSERIEVVHGLQVKCDREGGCQPHREMSKKSRDCTWLTGKIRERRAGTFMSTLLFLRAA